MQPERNDVEQRAETALIVLDVHADPATVGSVDLDALRTAVADLAAAVAHDPDHPDAPYWEYRQAFGHVAVAEAVGGPEGAPDWDAGVRALRHLRRRHVDEPEIHTTLANDLAIMLYGRFNAVGVDWDDTEFGRRSDELSAEPATLAHGGDEVEMLVAARELVLARAAGDLWGRDRALARLAVVLPAIPDDNPALPGVLADYAELLSTVDDAAGEEDRRDQVIAALERSADLRDDRPEPDLLRLEGELRCFRGDDADDEVDLRRGAALLAEYVAGPDVEPAERAFVHAMLATGHARIWRMSHDTDGPAAVIAHVDAALAAGLDGVDVDLGLAARKQALDVLSESTTELLSAPERLPGTRGRFDDAVEALDRAPDADPAGRAELALSTAMVGTRMVRGASTVSELDRLAALIELARTHPHPTPEWKALLGTAESLVGVSGPGADMLRGTGSVGDLVKPWAGIGIADEVGAAIGPLAAVVTFLEAHRTGDLSRMAAGRQLFGPEPDGADQQIFAAWIDLIALHNAGAGSDEILPHLRSLIERIRADGDEDWNGSLLALLQIMLALYEGTDIPDVAAGTAPGNGPTLDARFGAMVRSVQTIGTLVRPRSPDEQWRVLRGEQERIAGLEPGSPERVFSAGLLATGWLQLARGRPRDPAPVEAAIRWWDECLDGFGGPTHPLWPEQCMGLAEAHRLRDRPGDRARSRTLGFDALRGRTWAAQLQAGSEQALVAARDAATQALTLAGWCAEDQAHDDLARAVEAGRGLALYAATTTRGVDGGLAALGRGDLAAEWRGTGGVDRLAIPGRPDVDLQGDLRRRVLLALHDGDPALLDPPGPERIRAALHACGAHALVHLVPAVPATADASAQPGRLVAIPVDGGVEVHDLPHLDAAPDGPLARYAAAYAGARAGTRGAVGARRVADALTDLAAWAWNAAGETLLTAGRRWSAGATPRLVVVAAGMLALVPWSASARNVDGGLRYLVEDMVLSSAASARLFCDAVVRPPVRDGRSIVVGNPTRDLPAAEGEVWAVREAFAPSADHLGMLDGAEAPDGAGTVAQVLDRLGRPCPVLHLACHGVAVSTAPAASYLLLADGRLPASLLLEPLTDRPLPLGTVMLSACSTHVVGERYDEAFSLSTAFLAAGARTVIGSLWNMADGATSWLTFLFHHHRHQGAAAADALRAAQLWMLDPDREIPDLMPDELLDVRIGSTPLEHPLSWAGLTHLGR